MSARISGPRRVRARVCNPATALLAALALGAAACGDSQPVVATRGAPGAPAASPAPAAGAAAAAPGAASDGDGGAAADASNPPPLTVVDNDFNESDRTRDPFRSFAREFVPVAPTERVAQNEIRLREYALDELRLVAVITGSDSPYAMVVDPTGRGSIIRRGEYVGRPETIGGGPEGSVPHQVPWRVSRIVAGRVRRDADNNITEIPGEVVFEREDRINPNAPRAERAITLNPAASAAAAAASSAEPPPGMMMPFMTGAPGAGGSPYLPGVPGAGPSGAPRGAMMVPGMPPGVLVGATPQQQVPGQPGMTVQSYTTIIPPTQAPAPPPTTIVVQAPSAAPNPQVVVQPPSNLPPPVVVTGSQPMPAAGLPR